jgi:hypothetical protein
MCNSREIGVGGGDGLEPPLNPPDSEPHLSYTIIQKKYGSLDMNSNLHKYF